MKLTDYPEGITYAWCAHQTFRRLGFAADDVWLVIAQASDDDNNLHAFMTLKAQGNELHVDCGPADEAFADTWKAFCDRFNNEEFQEDELQKLYGASNFSTHATQFALLLLEKGFKIPNAIRSMN